MLIEIPYLYNLRTEEKDINGFLFFELKNLKNNFEKFNFRNNFDKYLDVETYKYVLNNNIQIPKKFDLKYRWFYIKDEKIYYQRNFFKDLSFKMIYDFKEKKLETNYFFHKLIRFETGNIWPTGKILSNYIIYDLEKKGLVTFHGVAFKFKGKNFCVFAPGGNCKTPILKKIIQAGGEYICGDKVIIKDGKVYFTPPALGDQISIKDPSFINEIDHIFFVQFSSEKELKDIQSIQIINSYLDSFNIFNFLGSGWALNILKIWDKYPGVKDWYSFLSLNKVKSFKLIRGDFNFLLSTIKKII